MASTTTHDKNMEKLHAQDRKEIKALVKAPKGGNRMGDRYVAESPNFLHEAYGDGLGFEDVHHDSIHTPGKNKGAHTLTREANPVCAKSLWSLTDEQEAYLLSSKANDLLTSMDEFDWDPEMEDLNPQLEKMEEGMGAEFWDNIAEIMRQPRGTLYVEPNDMTLPDDYLTRIMDTSPARPINIPIKF
jgi:hypothetical protein